MQINNMNQNYMNRLQIKTTFNDERVNKTVNDKVDTSSISKKDVATAAAALSLTGGDLFKAKPATYTRNDVSAVGAVNNANKVQELQDFSLSPIKKADEITATKALEASKPVEPVAKEIIADPEMDNFLRNAFKVFDLNY